MSTTVISSAEPTLHHFCSKPGKFSRPENISSCAISFSSQFTKSRISVNNPSGSGRTRQRVGVQAFYAPAEATETLYELLGIPESGITSSDIKKAYKQMARKYHPDVSPPERVDEYTRRFIMVHEAYETLSNPQRRASYDRDLAGGSSGFHYSARKSQQNYHQNMEENEEWKMRWQSQLDGLKQRDFNKKSRGTTSWGARMRSQT